MILLASIHPEDVDPSVTPMDYSTFTTRPAGRAIVFDGDKVALIKVSSHGYYMLPGGGLDDDDIQAGIAREILEELGAEVRLDKEVGTIETFFDRWQQKQVDYCFTAHLIYADAQRDITEFEADEGHEICSLSPKLKDFVCVILKSPGDTLGPISVKFDRTDGVAEVARLR